ncbi:hypothetical protein ED28_08040 [[Pantoea] beijingensis]|uniref:DUF4440 domain-containing protein n=1 Tax=[Pantoea] beijingensis TaxID=1324864 RepID=A0A443IDG1_9GAMM|nr:MULTISPECIES: nuclear transport factor 2 family protein [Erwiniaceae]RWR02321.1 hypothetical protein ED28_08040 [[Pantoea] beijingensis]
MKKLLAGVALLTLSLSSTCFAQAQSADTKAVGDAVEVMRQAMLNVNQGVLEKVSAPNLTYGHSSGKLENRAEFIDDLVTGRSDFKTLNLNNQTIDVNDDVAVVRHTLEAKTNDSGKPGEVKIGVMQIWKKDKAGEWKLLARQAYKLPE